MSLISRFEDLDIWKESMILTIKIYKYKLIDHSFKDQIQRASISIMNNIAEGFERSSDKELVRFLYYSKASCAEVRSMLYVAEFILEDESEGIHKLIKDSKSLSSKIASLIKYLKKS